MKHDCSATRHLVALFAQTFDPERQILTWLQEFLRFSAGSDTGRRAGGDDVARHQGEPFGHKGHHMPDIENHGSGRAFLHAFLVDIEPHVEVLDIRNIVRRDKPRPERRKATVAFALGPLSGAFELPCAFGNIIHDSEAGDVLHGIGAGDFFGFSADDDGQFDFPVGFDRPLGYGDVIEGTGDGIG